VARELDFCPCSSWGFALRSLAAVCWLATSSCADSKPEPSEPRIWVGEVADSDVTVGIAASGGAATLFFCGGGSSYATRTHWFTTANWSSTDFSLQDEGFRVSGMTRDGQIEGMVELGEPQRLAFSARMPEPGTVAGVYEAVVPCGRAGLIVLQPAADADPRAQGTCLRRESDAAVVEQVNPVLPVMLDANRGVVVELESAPSERFLLHPLTP
jgi:hypothetical protein